MLVFLIEMSLYRNTSRDAGVGLSIDLINTLPFLAMLVAVVSFGHHPTSRRRWSSRRR